MTKNDNKSNQIKLFIYSSKYKGIDKMNNKRAWTRAQRTARASYM